MKKIKCKKPCNIGGTRFFIGDTVPEELVALGREATLAKYGLISVEEVPESAPDNPTNNTPDGGKDGVQEPERGQQQSESSTGSDEKGSADESTPDDASTGNNGKKKAGKKVSK